MAAKIEPTTYQLALDVVFRLATEEDLPRLEWYGQYLHFRNVFRSTFEEQKHGRRLMLLADLNGFPIGQIFILLGGGRPRLLQSRFERRSRNLGGRGYLYALRVMEHLQGLGIGTQLIRRAEKLLIEHDNTSVSISVAKTNPGARRLYERLGYRIYAEDDGRWQYVNHLNEIVQMDEPCWMLERFL